MALRLAEVFANANILTGLLGQLVQLDNSQIEDYSATDRS